MRHALHLLSRFAAFLLDNDGFMSPSIWETISLPFFSRSQFGMCSLPFFLFLVLLSMITFSLLIQLKWMFSIQCVVFLGINKKKYSVVLYYIYFSFFITRSHCAFLFQFNLRFQFQSVFVHSCHRMKALLLHALLCIFFLVTTFVNLLFYFWLFTKLFL